MANNARVQRILDDLAAQARRDGFRSYEDPTGGNYEVSMYETYLVSTGMDAYTAKAVANKAAVVPQMAANLRQAIAASNGQGMQGPVFSGAPDPVLAAANFGLTVKRNTAAIAFPLPFAMFGAQDYVNGYRNTLTGQLLPAGVTLVSVTGGEVSGKPNRVDFTYTDGVNSDVVEVTSSTYPYPSLLNSTSVDLLRMSKIRMELSDSTQAAQFRQDIQTVSNSPFGKGSTNKISATAFRRPDQFQAGIVDLDAVFEIDKETSIVSSILPKAGFEVTYNSFVEKFYRQITKGHW